MRIQLLLLYLLSWKYQLRKTKSWTEHREFIFGIIAVALCAIVAQNAMQPVVALGENCGSRWNPCHIKLDNVGLSGIVSVRVTNFGELATNLAYSLN